MVRKTLKLPENNSKNWRKFEIYEQGESELDKVNAQAGIAPVKVSKITFELVKALDKYAKTSDGYYNPTVGVMTHLWHIGFSDAQIPSGVNQSNSR
jgi:thiamine biosynthesis lipoprotein